MYIEMYDLFVTKFRPMVVSSRPSLRLFLHWPSRSTASGSCSEADKHASSEEVWETARKPRKLPGSLERAPLKGLWG